MPARSYTRSRWQDTPGRWADIAVVAIQRHGDGWVVDIYDWDQEPLITQYFHHRDQAETFARSWGIAPTRIA